MVSKVLKVIKEDPALLLIFAFPQSFHDILDPTFHRSVHPWGPAPLSSLLRLLFASFIIVVKGGFALGSSFPPGPAFIILFIVIVIVITSTVFLWLRGAL